MSLAENPPPPLGPEWKPWGERLVSFLARTKTKLAYYIAGDTAAEDGVVLWDRTGYPVVSKNGEFRQIVLADGYGEFSATSSITAASADTAYNISFTSVNANGGLSIDPSDKKKLGLLKRGCILLRDTCSLNRQADQRRQRIIGWLLMGPTWTTQKGLRCMLTISLLSWLLVTKLR